MKPLSQPFRRLMARGQHWFIRSRAGSVLILVVALLVLMALIGTAFMSMAQADRTTASLHTNNTEVDLLVDGIVALVKGQISNEIYIGSQYRPGFQNAAPYATYGSGAAGTYPNVTALGPDSSSVAVGVLPGSTFLASRLPETQTELTGSNGVATNANWPWWRYTSAPVSGVQFASPLPPQLASTNTPFLTGENNQPLLTPYSYTQRTQLIPCSMTANDGTVYPAWSDNPANKNRMLAADTDGDGIADAGYIKLPMGQVNGLTYYAAVRIVDASSAVNANIAWINNPITVASPGNTTTPPQLPGDFFPTNIDLFDLIDTNDTLDPLMAYRFGTAVPLPQNSIIAKNADPPVSPPPSPTARTDFPSMKFGTAMEALWMQAGRRMNNPITPFQSLPASDTTALARNFILAPVGATPSSVSTLERDLQYSLIVNAPTAPFTDPLAWYNNNFSFMHQLQASPNRMLPLRSMLTLSNPVTNYAPNKFRSVQIGSPPADGFQFGDMITYTDTTVSPNVTGHFVCINPQYATAVPPGYPSGHMPVSAVGTPPAPTNAAQYDNDVWVYEPWTDAPTKTSINTGTFGQLWLAYWGVMADQFRPDANGYGTWQPAFPYPAVAAQPLGAVPNSRMFRSPLRLPTVPDGANYYLTPMQVMQLRAAIAAVNTMDMRDPDDDVTARTVHLYDPSNNDGTNAPTARNGMVDVVATVYGTERQPFITQVYATNAKNSNDANRDGYVAIQLYNPDPVQLTLTNWQLGYVTRADGTVAPNGPDYRPTTITLPSPSPVIQIPPNGYVVIASATAPPNGVTLPPTVLAPPTPPATPVPGQINMYVIPNLLNVLSGPGQELYLFRPHNGVGAMAATIASANTGATYNPVPSNFTTPPNTPQLYYNEGNATTPNLLDMIPVDSYDFTGLTTPAPTPVPTEWYYVRPSLSTSPTPTAWHFVYPGHYMFQKAGSTINTVLGTEAPRYYDGTAVNINATSAGLGQVFQLAKNVVSGSTIIPMDAGQASAALLTYHDVPLQLNSADFAGPNAGSAAGTRAKTLNENNGFPYGCFARNVDILEVPYIGSYRLSFFNLATKAWQVLELNTPSTDSVMAMGLSQIAWQELDDPYFKADPVNVGGTGRDPLYDPTNLDPVENIGRFAPISSSDFAGATPGKPDDFALSLGGSPPQPNQQWLYHWSTRIFDYLTVQCPQQDYLPDVDPGLNDQNSTYAYRYGMGSGVAGAMQPQAVANSNKNVTNAEQYNPGSANEQTGTVQGLININTAPWQVLATVPWLPPDYYSSDRARNMANIALSIVYYRDVKDPATGVAHGPFRSLFELNNVPIQPFFTPTAIPPNTYFRDLMSTGFNVTTTSQSTAFGPDAGKISPSAAAGTPQVPGDFMNKYLMINRVSNLLTTRSDAFVAYILIEGWRNAEQPTASVAVRRRVAYLIDRSSMTPSGQSSPSLTYVPSN